VGLHHIHVALDDDRRLRLADLAAGQVQAEERAGLVEKLALRGVEVLGHVLVAQRPRAEADHAPPAVADGDHQPVAEAIVNAALVVADGDARRHDVRRAVAQALQMAERRLPVVRGVAQQKIGDRLLVQAASHQVGAGDFRLRGLLQQAVVEAGRFLQQAEHPLEEGVVLLLLHRARPQLNAGPLGQVGQGFVEVPAVLLHGKGDDVAALAARAKAAPVLRFREDDKRRRALLVEGAAGLVAAAGFLQRNGLGNISHQVKAGFDLVNDRHGQPPLGHRMWLDYTRRRTFVQK